VNCELPTTYSLPHLAYRSSLFPSGEKGARNKQKAVGSGQFIIHNLQFIIIYVYFSHRSNSTSDGLLPYIKMPTR
jgi:hypothetical protein